MSQPTCPKCNAVGTDHIEVVDSKQKSESGETWFEIVYCDNCGYVYGVFAKNVISTVVPPSFPEMPDLP